MLSIADISYLASKEEYQPIASNQLQDNFQLAMKQLLHGLDISQLLAHNPLVDKLINQVQQLAPRIFEQSGKLLPDVACAAQLPGRDSYLQVKVNIWFGQAQTRIIEWAIRKPELLWSDRIKLWATQQYLELAPEELSLTIIAVNPHEAEGDLIDYNWTETDQVHTESWLRSLLNDNAPKTELTKARSRSVAAGKSPAAELAAKLIESALDAPEIPI